MIINDSSVPSIVFFFMFQNGGQCRFVCSVRVCTVILNTLHQTFVADIDGRVRQIRGRKWYRS